MNSRRNVAVGSSAVRGSSSRISVAVAFLALAALLWGSPALRAQTPQDKLLAFCQKNKAHCAISVAALSEKWERHLNPDRAQSLGSAFKVASLIAYANAVAAGTLDPGDTISKEEWARFLTLDGGALASSWSDHGQPSQLTLDDLATSMIQRSDNSFPDWLLAELGPAALANVAKLFPFHDPMAAISGQIGVWNGSLGEGGAGNRVVFDYTGSGVAGYQAEVKALFDALRTQDSAVNLNRTSLCVQPPWVGGPPPCNPPQPGINEQSYRTALREFFTRSTTRSYLKVYKGLLEGNLLPAKQQQIVRRHLESWLDLFPTLSPAFKRYGLKGGGLATSAGRDVLTWAQHMELANGQRYVVVVFLQGLLETTGPPDTTQLNAFAQQFALNTTFRNKVKKTLAAQDKRPEITATIQSVVRKGNNVTAKVRVDNISPNPTGKPFSVELRLWNASTASVVKVLKTAQVAALGGSKNKVLTLRGLSPIDPLGLFAVVHVDSKAAVAEQDESDNIAWSRIR